MFDSRLLRTLENRTRHPFQARKVALWSNFRTMFELLYAFVGSIKDRDSPAIRCKGRRNSSFREAIPKRQVRFKINCNFIPKGLSAPIKPYKNWTIIKRIPTGIYSYRFMARFCRIRNCRSNCCSR